MRERFPDVDPARLDGLLARYEALVVAQQEAILALRAERDAARQTEARLAALEAATLRSVMLIERLVARMDMVVLRSKGEVRVKACAFLLEGGAACGRPFRPHGGGQKYCDDCGRVAKARGVATGRRNLAGKRRAERAEVMAT